MEIERLSDFNKNDWNEFCLKSNNAWFRHTTHWMDYILLCRFDSDSKNHSFLVRQNNEIVALVPLISQYCYVNKEIYEFANYDTPTPYFALKDDNLNINKSKVIKFINEEIDKIALEYNITKRSFYIDPLIKNNFFFNFEYFNLLKYGYKCSINTTNILELVFTEEEILSKMNKGHKSEIKKSLKDRDIRIDCIDSTSKNIFDLLMDFKNIHIIDSGRQTRTDDSWECQFSWLVNGYAVLLLAWSNSQNKYVCGAFIIKYKENAYYGSYATIDSAFNDSILGYLIQWNVIKYLKNNKYLKYDIGKNYYLSSFENEYDQKLVNISNFKRGFVDGGIPFLEYSL